MRVSADTTHANPSRRILGKGVPHNITMSAVVAVIGMPLVVAGPREFWWPRPGRPGRAASGFSPSAPLRLAPRRSVCCKSTLSSWARQVGATEVGSAKGGFPQVGLNQDRMTQIGLALQVGCDKVG